MTPGQSRSAKKQRPFAPLFTKRYAAADQPCPKCGAKADYPCTRPSGRPRLSVHRERMGASS